MEKRISWIDTAKGIVILFVVLGHVSENKYLINYIFSFHIPFFFFLSGFLFKSEKYNNFTQFAKKRFKQLIVPYFCFSVIAYLYWIISSFLGTSQGFSIPFYRPFLSILYSNGMYGWPIYNGALWFLTCLFITELIFFAVNKFAHKKIMLGIVIFLFSLIGYFAGSRGLIRYAPWQIDASFSAVVFYSIGFLLKKDGIINTILLKYNKIILLPVLFFLSMLLAQINGKADMNINYYGNYFIFYVTAFSGILFYIIVSEKIKKSAMLTFLGKNSIIILGMHIITNILAIKLFLLFSPCNEQLLRQSPCWSVALTGVSVLFILPFIVLINRFVPFVAGKTKNGSTLVSK